jgi:sterol desaturase/sphingolipid hydroxylase (fatty acid hydroxylase superfamily)
MHRAFHLRSLHWIHLEHHKSRLNSAFTAISFSFTEKLVFDLGLLTPLAILDRFIGVNAFGIATWYVGYLLINSFSHANFELKSRDYPRSLDSLHHSRYTGNYGLRTRISGPHVRNGMGRLRGAHDRISRDRKPLRKLTERATVPVQGRERG